MKKYRLYKYAEQTKKTPKEQAKILMNSKSESPRSIALTVSHSMLQVTLASITGTLNHIIPAINNIKESGTLTITDPDFVQATLGIFLVGSAIANLLAYIIPEKKRIREFDVLYDYVYMDPEEFDNKYLK